MLPDEPFDEVSNLDEVLHLPMSRRAWLIRWGALTLTVVVIVTMSITLYWPHLAAVVHPTHTTYVLYVTSNVNWGAITLTRDGQHIALSTAPGLPPYAHFTQGSTPMHLTVSITAAPFITKRCQLTIPPVHGDTCLGRNGEDVQTMGNAFATRDAIPLDVDFPFMLNDLPPGRRGDILDLVDQALQTTLPSARVVPSSHYTTGGILGEAVVVASQPLIASLITVRVIGTDSACSIICAPNTFIADHHSNLAVWHVRINVQQSWRYARADNGASIATGYENLLTSITFDLIYDPVAQAWQLPATDQPLTLPTTAALHALCADGQAFLDELTFQSLLTQAHLSADAKSIDHGVDGCLLQVASQVQHGIPATFLWRFGQMYSANAAAQQAAAALPVTAPQDLASFVG